MIVSPASLQVLDVIAARADTMSFTDTSPLLAELAMTDRELADACDELADAGLIRTAFDGGVLYPTGAGPTKSGMALVRRS